MVKITSVEEGMDLAERNYKCVGGIGLVEKTASASL